MRRGDLQQWHDDTMTMIRDPKRGDHFTEMCGSVALVTHRFGPYVVVRTTEIHKGAKRWTRQKVMNLRCFRDLLTYSTDRNSTPNDGHREGHIPRFLNRTASSADEGR